MQSYQLHVVSEQLKDRHPYLEPPFAARYNKTEVHYAVFDRSIPKLIEILLMEGIETHKYRDALITLNELASHENDKDSMISQGVIAIASAYIHCKIDDIRRQAILLLGSLLSGPRGLNFIDSQFYKGLEKLLFDTHLDVRKATAWCICRIASSRAGVELLCSNKVVAIIIKSFLHVSETIRAEEEPYLIYILQALNHILSYDNGIQFALSTGLTQRLNQLCLNDKFSQHNINTIQCLLLNNLSKIASNPKGKAQGITENIIKTAASFLDSPSAETVKYAIAVIMLTSIHLNGKKQCIYDAKGAISTEILTKLIKLLKSPDQLIKKDVVECLRIISQLKEIFLAITELMAKDSQLQFLNEIYSSKVVMALADLLPEARDLEQPPILPSLKVHEYKLYVKALNYFLNQFDQALQIALQETVDIALKLLPFMCYRGDREVQEGTALSLIKLIEKDESTRSKIREYVARYGSVTHRTSQTTLLNEITNNRKLFSTIQL